MEEKQQNVDDGNDSQLFIRLSGGLVLVVAGAVFIGTYESLLTTVGAYLLLFFTGFAGVTGLFDSDSDSDTSSTTPDTDANSADVPTTSGEPQSFVPYSSQTAMSTKGEDPATVSQEDALDPVDPEKISQKIDIEDAKTLTPAEVAAIVSNIDHSDWKQRAGTAAALGWTVRNNSREAIETVYTGEWDLGFDLMKEFYNMIVYETDEMLDVQTQGSFALFHFTKDSPFITHSFVDKNDHNLEKGLMMTAENGELADTTTANVIGIVALSMADHRSHEDPPDIGWFEQFESHDHGKVREAAQWGKEYIKSQRD